MQIKRIWFEFLWTSHCRYCKTLPCKRFILFSFLFLQIKQPSNNILSDNEIKTFENISRSWNIYGKSM
jgi:hypothetical protein